MRVDSLLRPQPVAPLSPRPVFARLISEAERLRQALARHDRQAAAAAAAAEAAAVAVRPVPSLTPKQAGYPAPFLSPAQQAQRRHAAQVRQQLQQRLLADFNTQAQAAYLPAFLRRALADPLGNLRLALPKPLTAGGRDCFMPLTFWKSQNPTGAKGQWRDCCNTVKRMVGYNAPDRDRLQIVLEHGTSLVLQPTAKAALSILDKYMALGKPVMTGVTHTYGLKDNEKTTDHFVAIVGTGTDAKGKYYRFFDVGTTDARKDKGIDPSNRLYYDAGTGSYAGKSAVNGKTYTISQLRFKNGTF